jgi:tripartite ATP-independent transporter DctP family solute receptor
MLEIMFKPAAHQVRPVGGRSGASAAQFAAGLVAALLGFATLGAGTANASDAALRQLDIADYRAYLADDHPVRQGMRKFAELVDAGSNGTLRIKVRTDALPGPAGKQIAALRAPAADAPALMLVASTGLAAVAQEFAVLDLPFLVLDERHADALLEGAFGAALLARLAPTGLVGLAWWENGFRQMTASGEPIRRAADLRRLNFRVIGEPAFIDSMRAMGANPVPLPFSELYAALKSRRVDAQDNFYSQILAGRLYEVQSSLAVTNHSYSAMVLVANAALWRALAPAERALLQAAALEAARFQRRLVRDEAALARAGLAARGMVVTELDPAELMKLQDLTQAVRDRYFGNGKDGLRQLYEATNITRRQTNDKPQQAQ